MLLLRGAIRHSATAAAKRSGDSRYKIEPRVQVFCHPFKQRLEPRVHLAGRKIPASTMSGKRPFPNHSSSSDLARAICSDASTIQSTSSRPKLRAIDRRCTDNGRPHRRNRNNRAHRDPASAIDAGGAANRGGHQAGLRPQRSEGTAGLARWPPAVGRTLDRSWRRPIAEPIPRAVTKRPVSPCRGERARPPEEPVENAVLKLWNESRTNRARIADSSLVGFVHGDIS